ncbi:4-(cytidine 5'-diphospho)-2-C-methyl-D-erythritol kinase [Poriferisphaera sp. WC338]|uniref:4-(cytidine 5'-diphospho)-2-C-methyl-D-erythritol kinase n=1 Tax=Poriferisphaera sp. WC338 TaxID=3425129 RepID=UPI003D814891
MASPLMHVEPFAEAELLCPAKINLALSVGAPLDNGFHPIASWMVAVDFADQLSIQCIEGDEDRYHIAWADDAPVRQTVDWPVEKDLAYRAHRLLEEKIGKKLPAVEVTVSKHIPAGAGLGGGSSDAAGMLVGLNELFELKLEESSLLELAIQLGCDVSFGIAAFHGKSSAIARGLGEVLEPSILTERIPIVLILPPFGCPTSDVYKQFDRLNDNVKTADPDAVVSLRHDLPLPFDGPFNDLAEPAMQVQPALREAVEHVQKIISRTVHVTGSGAAMFAIAETDEDAVMLQDLIIEGCNMPAVVTKTIQPR